MGKLGSGEVSALRTWSRARERSVEISEAVRVAEGFVSLGFTESCSSESVACVTGVRGLDGPASV